MSLKVTHAIIIFGALEISACQAQSNASHNHQPNHIASTSLCGDTYLQAFAPDNISALSWQSNSILSQASEAEKQLPQINSSIESLLPFSENWVLFGPGESGGRTAVLPHTLDLTWVESFEGVEQNARYLLKVASLPEDIIDNWHAQVSNLKAKGEEIKRSGQSPKILYLSRAGGSAGPDTFVDAVITASGGTNANPVNGWHTPNIETLLQYDADIILSSFNGGDYHSRSDTDNPVLQNYINQKTIIEVDGKYWPCAGPGLLEAAKTLQDGIQTWSARHDA